MTTHASMESAHRRVVCKEDTTINQIPMAQAKGKKPLQHTRPDGAAASAAGFRRCANPLM